MTVVEAPTERVIESVQPPDARSEPIERWRAASVRHRVKCFKNLRHALAARANEFAALIVAAKDCSTAEALASEVLPVLDAIRFIERNLSRVLKPRRIGARQRPAWMVGVKLAIYREPLGNVLVIGPRNYPFFLPAVQALQASAVGNAVFIQPAPNGVELMRRLCELCAAAGVGSGAMLVRPAAHSSPINDLAAVDHVVFTGSRATGLKVMASAAERGIATTMELSGHDAVFVLPGADLELVARAMRFGLSLNRSETCIAPRRLFAQRAEIEKLLPYLEKECGNLEAKPISRPGAQRLRSLAQDALDRGARLLCGGPDANQRNEAKPVVLVNVPAEADVLRHEAFTPILAVSEVDSMDEALELDNECGMALGASIFGPAGAARRFAGRVKAGCVVINDVIAPTGDARLPFGGRNDSGFGVTRGLEGMIAMTQIKAIATRGGRSQFRPHYDLANGMDAAIFMEYIRSVHGKSLRERLGSAMRLIKSAISFKRSQL